jgi:beta-phosphoglucomutase-like phosphatase (HAD superfamily)
MIGAMLYEVEGVLANTEPLRRAALLRALAEEGIEQLDPANALPDAHGGDSREVVRLALRHHAIASDEAAITLIAHRADRHFASLVHTGLSLAPGAREMIANAAAQCRLAIVTGLDRDTVGALLALADLDGAFEVIVAAEDVLAAKPAPDGYRKSLDRMRRRRPLDAHTAIAIEPDVIGARAARAAGLRCVVVSPPRADVIAHADALIASLAGETPATLDALLAMQAAG